MMQQGRDAEAETLLREVSRPKKYRMGQSGNTGDHPDRWDALWTLVQCYQIQGQLKASLVTCGELMEAVRTIQEGRGQTEVSSTFWRRVVEKKAE